MKRTRENADRFDWVGRGGIKVARGGAPVVPEPAPVRRRRRRCSRDCTRKSGPFSRPREGRVRPRKRKERSAGCLPLLTFT